MYSNSSPEAKDVSVIESIKIGAAASSAEIMINHPLWVLKTRQQCGYKFTWHPAILYTGITYHAINEILLGTFQIVMSLQLENKLINYFPMSSYNNTIFSSVVAGGLSGYIAGPLELVMTQQQKLSKSNLADKNATDFWKISKGIYYSHGYKRFFVGSTSIVIREAAYTCGFISAPSILGKKLEPYIHNHSVSSFMAGTIGGIFSATITHPFDTIKSIQHDQALENHKIKLWATSKLLYKQEGYKGFFKGLVARSTRVASASAIISGVMESMKPSF